MTLDTDTPPRQPLVLPPPAREAAWPTAETVGGIELTRVPLLHYALTRRWVQKAFQTLTLALFVYVLFDGFFGTQDFHASFSYAAIWMLWWSPVMTISLLLVGRAWCWVCPIGFVTNSLQRFSLQRKFPTYLEPKVRVFGLGLSVLSIPALTFLVSRAALYGGIMTVPWMSAAYFVTMLLVAVALTLVFRQRVFCRYVCPATAAMTVAAKLAPIELVQVRDRGVADCMTAEFQSNYLSRDRRCVACMNCVTSHPDTPVRLRVRWPGAFAIRERIALPDEGLMAIVLFGIFPLNHVIVPWLFSTVAPLHASQIALGPMLADYLRYSTAVGLALGSFCLANLVASRLGHLPWEQSFTHFANAYLAPALVFQLGAHVVADLASGGGTLLNRLAAGFGLAPHFSAAWASPEVLSLWMTFQMTGMHWVGAAWGVAIAWFIARHLTRGRGLAATIGAFAPHFALLTGTAWAVVTLMPSMMKM